MSLEDAVDRLVNVLGSRERDVAVKEIIRQRDDALAKFHAAKNSAEMYERWYGERVKENARLGRVVSALRGVVTRMKHKQQSATNPDAAKS